MILSTAYLPPVSWFSLIAREKGSPVMLEACENYQKQSYRNRCCILASDGLQMLQVPVVHSADMNIREVLIDYSTPWVVRTERALSTAYETSAFFEYYRDGLFAILESGEPHLWDFNLALARWCTLKAGIPCALVPTADFATPGSLPDDFRFSLHPKREPVLPEKPHYQVFRDRLGRFTPGLSILDLLFNEGPESVSYI